MRNGLGLSMNWNFYSFADHDRDSISIPINCFISRMWVNTLSLNRTVLLWLSSEVSWLCRNWVWWMSQWIARTFRLTSLYTPILDSGWEILIFKSGRSVMTFPRCLCIYSMLSVEATFLLISFFSAPVHFVTDFMHLCNRLLIESRFRVQINAEMLFLRLKVLFLCVCWLILLVLILFSLHWQCRSWSGNLFWISLWRMQYH